MTRASLRHLWVKAHRWTALTLGWLLALAALLGALLTVAKPLDQWLNQHLFTQLPLPISQPRATLDSIHSHLRDEFGPAATVTFRPPREVDDTLWVHVKSPEWEGKVFFDALGHELGRRADEEGFYSLLFELHSTLLLGETGRGLLTLTSLAYAVLLSTGLVLWWPLRWPPSWAVRMNRGWWVMCFDLHRSLGAVLGILIAISVLSGAYMAWPPLRGMVSSLFGESPVLPPTVPSRPDLLHRAPLDQLVTTARAHFPDAMVGYVQVPGSLQKPVRVRLKVADDKHPNGLSSVWLHPLSGEVLASTRWDQLDVGSRYITLIYPLHTGALGGWPLISAVGLLGLALAGLGLTGLWLWGQRRWSTLQRKRANPAARTGSR